MLDKRWTSTKILPSFDMFNNDATSVAFVSSVFFVNPLLTAIGRLAYRDGKKSVSPPPMIFLHFSKGNHRRGINFPPSRYRSATRGQLLTGYPLFLCHPNATPRNSIPQLLVVVPTAWFAANLFLPRRAESNICVLFLLNKNSLILWIRDLGSATRSPCCHDFPCPAAGESGSDAGQLHEEKALLGGKIKTIFC